MRTTLAALVAVLVGSTVARAQVGPDEARLARLAILERTRSARVRWDGETGTPANVRFESGAALPGTPAEAARRLLDDEVSDLFEAGLRTTASEAEAPAGATALALAGERDLGAARVRVDFDELVGGVPVHRARLSVELARTPEGLAPIQIYGRYVPDVKPAHVDARSVEAALEERYPEVLDGKRTCKPERRLVLANGRLAFEVTGIIRGEPLGVLVDAETGAELGTESLASDATAEGEAYEKNPRDTPRTLLPLRFLTVDQGAARATTDASGSYNLVGSVTLERGLDGPYSRVFNSSGPELVFSGPADIRLSPDVGSADEDQVAAFQHVGAYVDYMVRTYPMADTGAHTRFAVFVRASKNGKPVVNNSWFIHGRITAGGETFEHGYVDLGVCEHGGGVASTACSSMIVHHEYTHAIMSRYCRLTGSQQASGISEGLADYFPCVMEEDPHFGTWCWNPFLRSLTRHYVWPTDDDGDVHRIGNILSGALWDARSAAESLAKGGRLRVDQAVWGGLLRMPDRPALLDARDAIVEADRAINGGANVELLEQALFDHGIGPKPSAAASPGVSGPAPGASGPSTGSVPVPGGSGPSAGSSSTASAATVPSGAAASAPLAGPGHNGGGGCELSESEGDVAHLAPLLALVLLAALRRLSAAA